MNYVLYCRRSQDREDKQVQSIDSQIVELKALAKRRGLNIVKVFVESMSAKKPGRPVFAEMLKMIDDKQADGIICWKYDRLSRNPIDGGAIAYRLQNSTIKQIITIERDYNPEDNVIMMSVESGMATQYSIDLSRNVKRGMRAKVRDGWMPNRPTCGWTYDKNTKKIIEDEYNFPRVQKLLELALTGTRNAQQLVKIANEELHIKYRVKGALIEGKVGKCYVLRMLRNPFHAGTVVYGGEQSAGAHKAMITKGEHEHLLELYGEIGTRNDKSPMVAIQERHKKYSYKLQGLFVCPCGRKVSPWRIKNYEGGKKYLYYSCGSRFSKKHLRCGQPMIRAGDLEESVRSLLQRIQIDEKLIVWIRENLQDDLSSEEVQQKALMLSLRKRMEQLEITKKNLLDHLLSDTIAGDVYHEKDNQLKEEINSIARQLKEEEGRIERQKQENDEALQIADRLVAIFDEDDFEKTKQMIRSVFVSMELIDGKAMMVLKKPFQVIEETKHEKRELFRSSE